MKNAADCGDEAKRVNHCRYQEASKTWFSTYGSKVGNTYESISETSLGTANACVGQQHGEPLARMSISNSRRLNALWGIKHRGNKRKMSYNKRLLREWKASRPINIRDFFRMKAIAAALAIGQTGVAARKFWTSKPADPGNVLMTGYTIGNGRQAGKGVENNEEKKWLKIIVGWFSCRLTAGNTWRRFIMYERW